LKDIRYAEFVLKTTTDPQTAFEASEKKLAARNKLMPIQGEIEKALDTIAKAEFKMGAVSNARRRRVLQAYRDSLVNGKDVVTGEAYSAPPSLLSPSPVDWSDESGWASFKFSAGNTIDTYNKHVSRIAGSGGLNLGFISIGGSAGKETEEERNFKQVSNFGYSFEIKRVTIDRPWFDADVFDSPGRWTWLKKANTPTFPYTAIARKEGIPVESKLKYDNSDVALALLPVQLVIGRNVQASATVSKKEYELIKKRFNAGGGATLFGIIALGGSGGNSDISSKEVGDNVEFSITFKGIMVIATVSRILPICPTPNPKDKYNPSEAMLPNR
jgi:hypothetical protein